MGAYHIGVAACLIDQKKIQPQQFDAPLEYSSSNAQVFERFTGVSAGALVSSAIVCGVRMKDDAMNILFNITSDLRKNCGMLDALTPGYSLLDELEREMLPTLKVALNNGDDDLFRRRVANGRLRIGLSDVKEMKACLLGSGTRLKDLKQASYRYVDKFDVVEDVVAASMISSYIPGVTGPLRPFSDNLNTAIMRSAFLLDERKSQICDYDGNSAYIFHENEKIDAKEKFNLIDGGVVNMWPSFDNQTTIVSPLSGSFTPNPNISPCRTKHSNESNSKLTPWATNIKIKDLGGNIEVDMSKDNIGTLKRMLVSSTSDELEIRFENGYEDAKQFLDKKGLLEVFSKPSI